MANSALWVNLPVAPIPGYSDKSALGKIRDAIRRLEETQAVSDTTLTFTTNTSNSAVQPTRNVTTTAPLAGGGSLANDLILSIPKATAAVDGYLAAADFATFNAKVSTARTINTSAPLAGGGTLASDLTLSIPKATAAVDGYLAAADFATFNAKVSTTRAINTSGPLTGGGTLASDLTLSIPKATAAVDGYLAAADFAAFNAKVSTSRAINTSSPLVGGGNLASDLTLSVAIATTSSLGVVKAGSGLTIAADGTLAVDSTTAADALGPDPLHYYIHKQTTAATVWNVRHPLGKIPTGLLVVLSNGMVAEPDVQVSFTAGIQHYEHVQGAASASWTVAHGLGQMPSGVMVYDSGGNKIEPDIQIDTSAPYNVNLTFTEAVVGRCEVSIGGDKYPMTLTFTEAVSGSAYVAIGSNLSTYVHTQGSANTTWTINHGLGRVPACLQVLDNAGNKLEPDITVLVSSPFTVTLTFTAATAGTARLS